MRNLTTKPLSVLIVDDDEFDRILLSNLMSEIQFSYKLNITQTSDPFEALEICSANNFDVVLLDFLMGRMNGIEFLERLDSNNIKSSSTIMISGYLSEPVVERAKSLGVKEFIDKQNLSFETLSQALLTTIDNVH